MTKKDIPPTYWRFLRDAHPQSGSYNMAVDETLSTCCEKGISPSTIRFYEWNRPTLSVGYTQKIEKIVDREYCTKNGIEIVRRITGGRAVFHHKELTYSLTSQYGSPFPPTLMGSYKVVQEGILKGFSLLHISSEARRSNTTGGGDACFAAASLHEITIDNKKVAGSAQRRFKHSFLQHGSIILEADVETLSRCFSFPSEKEREKYREFLTHNMCGINNLPARNVTFQELSEALLKGLEQALLIETVPENLSAEETRMIQEILQKKKRLDGTPSVSSDFS